MSDLLLAHAWPDQPSAALPLAETSRAVEPAGRGAASARPPARVASAILVGVVCLAPLPFGSTTPLPIGLIGLALACGLACAPLPTRTAQRGLLMGIAVLTGSIVTVVALQLRPGTVNDPFWSEAAHLLGHPVTGTAALVRGAPLFALGPSALCLATVTLGLLVGADRRRARQLVRAAGWAALAYAVIGIVNAATDPQSLLWRDRDDYMGAVLGPFVNRNTAAIYFGCGAVLWIIRLAAVLPRFDRLAARGTWPVWKPLIGPGLAACTCLAAVVATGSRSGTLLGLSGVVVVAFWSCRADLRRAPPRLRSMLLAAPVLLSVVTLLGGTAGFRLQSLGFADEGRLAVYRAVMPMIASHPWLGTGLGTFAAVYPAYRSSVPGMRNVWDKAHSTPLELAAELGLPLTILICAAAGVTMAVLLRGTTVRRRDGDIPLAAAGCFGMAALQSCIDFSLQIPGLAVVVMGLVGVGLAQSFNTGDRELRRTAAERRTDAPSGPDQRSGAASVWT